jgi:uncharacterized protein involved in cysteine biosynthesis
MKRIGLALARALPAIVHPRVVAVVLLPLIAAAMLWTVIGYFAWRPFTAWVAGHLSTEGGWLASLVQGASALVALLLLFAGALVTLLIAIATLAMPVLTSVAAASLPPLAEKHGGTFAGSLGNALVALLFYVPLWLASLVLIVFPPAALAASWLLTAWLNQRLFRYDALATHASADEMRTIFRTARGRLFALGLALVPLAFVPFVNLVAPLYAGLAFAYLCLDELASLRGAYNPPR